jgi:hypothetical protein
MTPSEDSFNATFKHSLTQRHRISVTRTGGKIAVYCDNGEEHVDVRHGQHDFVKGGVLKFSATYQRSVHVQTKLINILLKKVRVANGSRW